MGKQLQPRKASERGRGESCKAAKKSAQRCRNLLPAERLVRACKLFPPKRRSLKQAKAGREEEGAELRAPEQTIALPLIGGEPGSEERRIKAAPRPFVPQSKSSEAEKISSTEGGWIIRPRAVKVGRKASPLGFPPYFLGGSGRSGWRARRYLTRLSCEVGGVG